VTRHCVPLLSGLLIPLHCVLEALIYPHPFLVHDPKITLRGRIAAFRSLQQPLRSLCGISGDTIAVVVRATENVLSFSVAPFCLCLKLLERRWIEWSLPHLSAPSKRPRPLKAVDYYLAGLFKLIVQRNLVEEPSDGNARGNSPPTTTKKYRADQEIHGGQTCCDPYPPDNAIDQKFDPGLLRCRHDAPSQIADCSEASGVAQLAMRWAHPSLNRSGIVGEAEGEVAWPLP